jgi:hypothetical protein
VSEPVHDPETGALVELRPHFEWPAGVHPAADLFPMIAPADFAGFVTDVQVNGQLEPIWLDVDGRILDGRNRLAACQHLGIEPQTRVYEGDEPTNTVLSLNLHRRHLTASQLACVAVDALPMFQAEAKSRQVEAGKQFGAGHPREEVGAHVRQPPETERDRSHRADEQAAAAVGVGGRIVSMAKRVKAADPETFDRVKAGELSVRQAERESVPEVTPRFKPGTAKSLAIKQPPKMGGNRRKHKEMVEALINTIDGAAMAFAEIKSVDDLDQTIDAEEAARLRGDLSKQIRSINRINSLLKERTE